MNSSLRAIKKYITPLICLLIFSIQPLSTKSQVDQPKFLIAYPIHGYCSTGQQCAVNLGILNPENNETSVLEVGLIPSPEAIQASSTGFIMYPDYEGLHIFKTDGSEARIFYGLHDGIWSPDGQWIGSWTSNGLVVMSADGHMRALVTLPQDFHLEWFSWSPASQQIVLLGLPSYPILPPFPTDYPAGIDEYYRNNREILDKWENLGELFLVDINELQAVRLTYNDTRDGYPEWTPNGNYISVVDLHGNIDLIEVANPENRTRMSGYSRLWVNDTQVISAFRLDDNKNILFKLTDLNSGVGQELFSAYQPLRWSLSPDARLILYTTPDLNYPPTRKVCVYDLEMNTSRCFENLNIYYDSGAIWVPNP